MSGYHNKLQQWVSKKKMVLAKISKFCRTTFQATQTKTLLQTKNLESLARFVAHDRLVEALLPTDHHLITFAFNWSQLITFSKIFVCKTTKSFLKVVTLVSQTMILVQRQCHLVWWLDKVNLSKSCVLIQLFCWYHIFFRKQPPQFVVLYN